MWQKKTKVWRPSNPRQSSIYNRRNGSMSSQAMGTYCQTGLSVERQSRVYHSRLVREFLQNPTMLQHLLSTGSRLHAEASPRDPTYLGNQITSRRSRRRHFIAVAGHQIVGLRLQHVRTLLREAASSSLSSSSSTSPGTS